MEEKSRFTALEGQILKLKNANNGLTNGNTALQSELQAMQAMLATGKAETADFERDPNQGSMTVGDLSKNLDSSGAPVEKEKSFLLGELLTIK